jgi:hypothetical protein
MYDDHGIPSLSTLGVERWFTTESGKTYVVKNGQISELSSSIIYRDGADRNVYELRTGGVVLQRTGSVQWRFFCRGMMKGTGFEKQPMPGGGLVDGSSLRFSIKDPSPFVISGFLLVLASSAFIVAARKRGNT